MNDELRDYWRRMIDDASVDKTDVIRDLKQSAVLRAEVPALLAILDKHYGCCSLPELRNMAELAAPKLAEMHVMLFSKMVKREISCHVVETFIATLEDIENGKINQVEASHIIGGLLKSEHLDPVMHGADVLVDSEGNTHEVPKCEVRPISWTQYKQKRRDIQTQIIIDGAAKQAEAKRKTKK